MSCCMNGLSLACGTDTRRNNEDWQEYAYTWRLLVLGTSEAGKTTFLKQLVYINDKDTFKEKWQDSLEMIKAIKMNIRDALIIIVEAMQMLDIAFEADEAATAAEYIVSIKDRDDYQFPSEFFDNASTMLGDGGLQQCIDRYTEYHLLDSAKYFLGRIDEIRKEDYYPNKEDIIRCRYKTTGINEVKFVSNNTNFRLFDVGGQTGERKKWIAIFDDAVTAIIFICDCSVYNVPWNDAQEEEELYGPCVSTTSRLGESLHLFDELWHNRWVARLSMILFLNKMDKLKEKLDHDRDKLEEYFPGISDMEAYVDDTEDIDFHKAKWYILHQFRQLAIDVEYRNFRGVARRVGAEVRLPVGDSRQRKPRTSIFGARSNTEYSWISANEDDRSARGSKFGRSGMQSLLEPPPDSFKYLYPHFTTCIDTNNIKRVFDSCQEIIRTEILRKYTLL